MNKMDVLAFIPARGGSKRIARKNIMPINGIPLINWTLSAAQKSKYINKIHVSTEDEEIADVVRSFGINITSLRHKNLATDNTTIDSVIYDFLINTLGVKEHPTHICLLQPTSPLRTEIHIDDAFKLLKQRNANSIISVSECECPIEWTGEIDDSLYMTNFVKKLSKPNQTQYLPVRYRVNGAIYIMETKLFLKKKSMNALESTIAYKMKREDSVDIDTNLDVLLASNLLKQKNEKK